MINLNKFKENIKKNIVKTIGISSFCNIFGMENNGNIKINKIEYNLANDFKKINLKYNDDENSNENDSNIFKINYLS